MKRITTKPTKHIENNEQKPFMALWSQRTLWLGLFKTGTSPHAVGSEKFVRKEVGFVLHARAAGDVIAEIIKWDFIRAGKIDLAQNAERAKAAPGGGGIEIKIHTAQRTLAHIAEPDAE